MPQENYKLIDINWDRTLEELRKSKLIIGDFSNEGIAYTKSVLCAHVRVKGEKVSFNLSPYGKIQLSNPNNEFLRKAKSILAELVECKRWSPTDEAIGEEKLERIVKIKDADRKIVLRILQVIQNEKNVDILLRRINELRLLSWKERVAHYPEVRLGIKEILEDSKVILNPEIFKELVYALAIIVDFEQRNKSPDFRELIEELVDDNFTLIATVIDSNPEFLGYPTLFFLGRSGKKEAVEIVFKFVKNNPENALREIENVGFALGKQNLYEKHQLVIDDKIDDLMRSHKEIFQKVAKKLDEIIRKRM